MKPPSRVVTRIADAFVLLPAGFGLLFLLLDLVPRTTGLREPSSAPLFAGGVFLTLGLRAWFRAEDRWRRQRLLREARRRPPREVDAGGLGCRGCGSRSAPRQR